MAQTPAERSAQRKAYRQTPEYKAWYSAYSKSSARKAVLVKHAQTLTFKTAQGRFKKTDKGKAMLHTQDSSTKGKARHSKYYKTARGKFSHYQQAARIRNYTWELTFEQFMMFWQKPCHYCDDPIETIGLDRIVNSEGYTIGNVVPCCFTCNTGKMSQSADSYIDHCLKVVQHSLHHKSTIPISPTQDLSPLPSPESAEPQPESCSDTEQ